MKEVSTLALTLTATLTMMTWKSPVYCLLFSERFSSKTFSAHARNLYRACAENTEEIFS